MTDYKRPTSTDAVLNVERVARFGAQVVVLSKLVDATLPHLTSMQRIEVEKAFRNGIEDAMAYVDDIVMPEQYHTTLMKLVNLYLALLRADHQQGAY